MEEKKETRVDKLLKWIKNNRLGSILIFIGICFIAFSTLVTSVKSLRDNLFGDNGLFVFTKEVVISNERSKNDSRSIEEIFRTGPLRFKLKFEEFELKGPEPIWQYSFLNDRIRFKAGFNEKVGKYITGGVFTNGEPAEKITQLDEGLLVDDRNIYFGWIEKPQLWSGYSGEYRLSRDEVSNNWEIDPISGSKVKYGSVFFEGFVNSEFKMENNTMEFRIIELNPDWAIIEIDSKFK